MRKRVLEDLTGSKSRKKNSTERAVAESLISQGYKVFVRGWPDILAVRGSEIRFIEVKKADGRSTGSPMQKLVAAIFKKHLGVGVEIAWGPEKIQSMPTGEVERYLA